MASVGRLLVCLALRSAFAAAGIVPAQGQQQSRFCAVFVSMGGSTTLHRLSSRARRKVSLSFFKTAKATTQQTWDWKQFRDN